MLIHIVDDNETNLMLFEQIARTVSPGAEIRCFLDPAQALLEVAEQPVDMVIVDYMMPGIDGHTYLRATRAMSHMRDVPIVMITAAGEKSVRHKALELGATDFVTKPVDVHEVRVRLSNLMQWRAGTIKLRDRNRWLADEVRAATDTIHDRERELIVRLSRAAEFRDPETGGHIQRMAHYSQVIARRMGMPADFCDLLLNAAPMHDVGKLGIPDGILLKPGKLDDAEFAIMKGHAVIGHSILVGSTSQLINLGAEIALAHHEKYDGSGYPNGVAGMDIPVAGRIVAVADVFDALTSERPYKRPWGANEAREFLLAHRGSHFDPVCVDAMIEGWDEVMSIRDRFVDVVVIPTLCEVGR